jgi:hypothetical protein
MAILTAIIVAVFGLLGATFSKLLADEFKAWAPSLTSRILAVATRALPPSQRARSAEEWKAHVNDTPGDLGRLLVACGCVFAAWKMKISGTVFAIDDRAVALKIIDMTATMALLRQDLEQMVAEMEQVDAEDSVAVLAVRDRAAQTLRWSFSKMAELTELLRSINRMDQAGMPYDAAFRDDAVSALGREQGRLAENFEALRIAEELARPVPQDVTQESEPPQP